MIKKHTFKNYETPWVESPLFNYFLKNQKSKYKKLAQKFNRDGYVIFDLKLSEKFINSITHDIQKKVEEDKVKKNPGIYHYNESPRVVEAWKFNKNVAKLSLNKKIIDVLTFFYKKKPLPISTINFIKGTEQPLHSDYMHFSSQPELYLAGAWVALEDTNKKNGPLTVVPGSHKLPVTDYNTLGLKRPDSIKTLEKAYRVYEDFVKCVVKSNRLRQKKLLMKKGEVVIWAANLLHGGSKMTNLHLTRKSQVTHYHFSGCKKYYNPGFSNPYEGDYALRKLEIVR